jgi:ankyrin repeat protein
LSQFLRLIQTGATAEIADAVEMDPALVEYRDPQGVSALLWSVYCRQPLVCNFLLSKLAAHEVALDVFEAAALSDEGRLKQILDTEPSALNEWSGDGWTPLHLAAAFGSPGTVELLLERGARVDTISENPQRNQPLHAVLALGKERATVELLLAHGADPNATQAGGFTALFSAAAANRRELAEVLLAHGANPKLKNDQGKSAAEYARERGHAEMADWLVSLETVG